MKKAFLTVITVLLAWGLAAVAYAQNMPFTGGEKLQYTVHYKCGFSADLASVNVSGTQEGSNFHVVLNMSTYKVWDTFYKMRDTYESTFKYAPGLQPVKYYRNVNEGSYWATNQFSWSSDGSSIHAIIDKKTRPHRDTTLKAESMIRDILNVIYLCRADYDKLAAGQKIYTLMTLDRDLFEINVRMIGPEKKKVGKNTYNTVKLGVSVKAREFDQDENNSEVQLGGDFKGKETLFFWFTDDDNRMPVMFSTSLKLGSIQGRLSSYSGNKYPVKSLIED